MRKSDDLVLRCTCEVQKNPSEKASGSPVKEHLPNSSSSGITRKKEE